MAGHGGAVPLFGRRRIPAIGSPSLKNETRSSLIVFFLNFLGCQDCIQYSYIGYNPWCDKETRKVARTREIEFGGVPPINQRGKKSCLGSVLMSAGLLLTA